jgi:hypothetical protein
MMETEAALERERRLRAGQGHPLVHFSAQPVPLLSLDPLN